MSTHSQFDSPAPPYSSLTLYEKYRPRYEIDTQDFDAFIASKIRARLCHQLEQRLIDCGSGPGLIWSYLSDIRKLDILAVEPNIAMWNPSPSRNVTYLKDDALKFLSKQPSGDAIITWLWSLNYPLLSFFEEYDLSTRKVLVKDWHLGAEKAVHALQQALRMQKHASWVVVFFDSDSAEQSFVTELWERIAPFPFHDRAYTRKLFESVVSDCGCFCQREHVSLVGHYGKLDQALACMMYFHLRGHFTDEATSSEVRRFLERYLTDNQVLLPCGAFLYTITPNVLG